MKLIVGLGNPEEEYDKTRHNMGFHVINLIAERYEISMNRKKMDAIYGKGKIEGEEVLLLKPQTYMNLSGKSIIQWMRFYKVLAKDVLVIYDDIDTQPGMIRIRKKGSSGSHNGMKSVVQELGTEEFPRIRIGIGKPEFKGDLINYVIGSVPEEEQEKLEDGCKLGEKAVIELLKHGIDSAMNKYN